MQHMTTSMIYYMGNQRIDGGTDRLTVSLSTLSTARASHTGTQTALSHDLQTVVGGCQTLAEPSFEAVTIHLASGWIAIEQTAD